MLNTIFDKFLKMYSSFAVIKPDSKHQKYRVKFEFLKGKTFIKNEIYIKVYGFDVTVNDKALILEKEIVDHKNLHKCIFFSMNAYQYIFGNHEEKINDYFDFTNTNIMTVNKLKFILGLKNYYDFHGDNIRLTTNTNKELVFRKKGTHFYDFAILVINLGSFVLHDTMTFCEVCFQNSPDIVKTNCNHKYCVACFLNGIDNCMLFCFFCKTPY